MALIKQLEPQTDQLPAVYQFKHLSFQEALAATAVIDESYESEAKGGSGANGGDGSAARAARVTQRSSLLARRLTRRLQLSSLAVGVAVAALGALVPVVGAGWVSQTVTHSLTHSLT